VIRADLPPFEEGETVSGMILLRSAVAGGDHSYVNTTTKGLRDFVENVRTRIREAAVVSRE
jgi:hypothetical protein